MLLALSMVAAMTAQAQQAPAAGGLSVEISATQNGDSIIYSITLINSSNVAVGDIYVAGSVPAGTEFVRAVATPSGSWFRGFEAAGTQHQAAVWLSSRVGPLQRQGPFIYEVKANSGFAPAHAWVRYMSPQETIMMSAQAQNLEYVGSEMCGACHAGKYNEFRVSGHPWKLRPAEEAMANPIPLPAGYTWDDISYVIGGYKWKIRYMDNEGYIITSVGGQPGNNQYNMANGRWVNYEAGNVKKYDCGPCHTTGYLPVGNQNGMPGIVGSWAFDGIQCEACHGPGSAHVASGGAKGTITVDTTASQCGQCHVRGNPERIPAANGFIEHREQFNELLASPHRNLTCVSCHDPHKKSELSIRADCASCHAGARQEFAGSSHQQMGVTCNDCHMPKAARNAVAVGKFQSDDATHMARITTDPNARMFTEDGRFANGRITLDFACLQCHQTRDVNWAAQYANGIHTLGKQ
jgi:uncharacterized repeat protein (TIGR01451 family)